MIKPSIHRGYAVVSETLGKGFRSMVWKKGRRVINLDDPANAMVFQREAEARIIKRECNAEFNGAEFGIFEVMS